MTAPKPGPLDVEPSDSWCPFCESQSGSQCRDTFTLFNGTRRSLPREEPHQERIDKAYEVAAAQKAREEGK